MKKQFLSFMFGVLMVCATLMGAMAYFDWTQALLTPTSGNPYTDYQVLSNSSITIESFSYNCTIPTTSQFQVLTDPYSHYIWVEGYSTLSIYDSSCNLLFEKSVNGTFYGNGILWNWDNDPYMDIVTIIKTPDGTISLVAYEFDTSWFNISISKIIDLGSIVTTSTSPFCHQASGYCSLYTNDNVGGAIYRVDFINGGWTHISSPISINRYQGTTLNSPYDSWTYANVYTPIHNGLTWGDFDDDGTDEVLYYTPKNTYLSYTYYKGWDIMVYDIIDNVVISSHGFAYSGDAEFYCGSSGSSSGGVMSFVGSPFFLGRVGANNSAIKLFFACSYDATGSDKVLVRVTDLNYNILATLADVTSGDARMSNFVFGDIDNDYALETCIVIKANLTCWESNWTAHFQGNIQEYQGETLPSAPIAISLVSVAGQNMQVMTSYGLKYLNGSNVSGWKLGVSSDYGLISPIDISDDNKLDLIWMGINGGIYLESGGGGCDDTDFNGTYWSDDPFVQGTRSGTGGNVTNATDSCYNSQLLNESFCVDATHTHGNGYILTNCSQYEGGVCINGACVPGNDSYCLDTDSNGSYPTANPFIIGTTYGTNFTDSTDYCMGNNLLVEYYCDNSSQAHEVPFYVNCSQWGYVCDEGVCHIPNVQTCTDNDIGFNDPSSVVSNIIIRLNNIPWYSVNDSCFNSTILKEMVCSNASSYTYQLYDCSQGLGECIDGRCDIGESAVCAQLGGVYINNQCVYNVSATCSDSDNTTGVFPTTNYTRKGTLKVQGMSPIDDYCWGDFLYEFYCNGTDDYQERSELYDCTLDGLRCYNGSCVGSNESGTCNDTDGTRYPSINETRAGVVNILYTGNNTTETYADECAGTTLREFYCPNANLPLAQYTDIVCYTFGMDCLNGSCVPRVNQTCEDSDRSYAHPQVVAGSVFMRVNGEVSLQINDECYNSTILRERVCRDNETSGTEAFDCSISSGYCANSKCVYPNQDIGIPSEDLRMCWYANGSFDWSCCTESQNESKTILCPISVGGKFLLGSIATFVLNNFIYFLILIIIFVLLAPYILHGLQNQNQRR